MGAPQIEFTKKYLPGLKGPDPDARTITRKARSISAACSPRFVDSGAQAIIMYGNADTTPIIARQMIEVGLAGKMPLIGNARIQYREAPSSRRRRRSKAPSRPPPGCRHGTRRGARLSSRSSKAKYRETPNNHAYVHWETVHLLAKAIEAAGSADRAKVRDALSKIKYDSADGRGDLRRSQPGSPAHDPARDRERQADHQGRLLSRDQISRASGANPREE